MAQIVLPAGGWRPRPYQQAMWDAWQKRDVRRVIEIAHRRWGKDEVCLHGTCIKAFERPANYWHCLPEYKQGHKAIWAAVNAHTGKRRIDEAFPHELRASTNENEMFIRFKNGSTWQVIGSDRYDNLVGAGVAGITYSEFAISNPSAWAYHRPMLEENNGWAAFITTPRGKNHAWSMYRHGRTSPDWFAELSSVVQTSALTAKQLREAQAEYAALYGSPEIAEALVAQEYYCSFAAAIIGAFYAREMQDVRAEGRILDVEAIAGRPVHRAWDIGVDDDTAIWWFQVVGTQILILDCYAASGAGVDHYVEKIAERRDTHGWTDGVDFVPHDAGHRQFVLEGARTTMQQMQSYGLKPQLVVQVSKQDGINAARKTLRHCVFHPRTEEVGLAALEHYRREWDDKRKAFRSTEVHDWSSHPADAFRYLALAWRHAPDLLADMPQPQVTSGVPLDIPSPQDPGRKRV